MRKKGIQEVLVSSVMRLYEGAKTRVRVDSELSDELEVKVGMDQGSLLTPFLFALVVDIVTEFARENKLLKWKESLESKHLKGNLGKSKVMVSSGITKHGLSKCNVDACFFPILFIFAEMYVQKTQTQIYRYIYSSDLLLTCQLRSIFSNGNTDNYCV